MTAPAFSDAHLNELAAVIRFTASDLSANRAGKLTRPQLRRLLNDTRRRYYPSLFAWSAFGTLVAVLALTSTETAWQWALVCVGVLGLGGLSVYELRGEVRGVVMAPHVVDHVTLHVSDDWQPRTRLHVLEFAVGGRWFAAPRTLRDVLRPGMYYRVYFARDLLSYPPAPNGASKRPPKSLGAAGSFRVLSVEPVSRHAPGP